MMPMTSFIIPARNAAATLSRTIASVRTQTCQDWRAVIVDDASEDETLAIALQEARNEPRISVINGKGDGVSAARNLALRSVETEWVCFLDADDEIDPEFLHLMSSATSAVDLIYCGYRRVDEHGRLILTALNRAFADGGFPVIARGAQPAIHGVLVRRACVMAVGGFDESLRVAEDRDLWQKLARGGARIGFVEQVLVTYRTGPVTLSRRFEEAARGSLDVLSRAYRPDPRICSLPAFEGGLPPQDEPLYAAFIIAWFAAAAAGAGDPVEGCLALLPQGVDIGGQERAFAATILDGLMVGSRRGAVDQVAVLQATRAEVDIILRRITEGSARAAMKSGLAYVLEFMALNSYDEAGDVALWQVQTLTINLDQPLAPLAIEPGVDAASVRLVTRGLVIAHAEIGLTGPLTNAAQLRLAQDLLDRGKVLLSRRFRPSILAWTKGIARVLRWMACGHVRLGQAMAVLITDMFEARARELGADRPIPEKNPGIALQPGSTPTVIPPDPVGRAAAWDDVFKNPDPWGYSSPYEQEKYDFTLELVPDGVETALEIACAEGLFTWRLAPRVSHLLAVDISEVALARARERCASASNVAFAPLDLTRDPIPGGNDLIICSEVLYYLKDTDQLAEVIGRLRDALKPGGRLVAAHYNLLSDDLAETAFDWDQAYGVKAIHASMAADPELRLERSILTDLYRIDCFRRMDGEAGTPAAVTERRERKGALRPGLERWVVQDALVRRSDLEKTEKTWFVPVLEYHRIAADGAPALARWRVSPENFERQLRLLRSNGYRSVTSQDLAQARQSGRALSGRPVLITFDDGYEDFAQTAWPILERNGFSAEVFIVSDLVGKASTWDARLGAPEPLMSWPTIAKLAGEGVTFGSHLASHTPAPNLPTAALEAEAEQSKREIETWTGRPVTAMALPYGAVDERSGRILYEAGYELAFTTTRGIANLQRHAFTIPRVEVRGDMTLAEFAGELGLSTPERLRDPDGAPPDDLVSVVIPSYNAERWLDATLQSVRSQTHRQLEIIVVDDGSTDMTAAIAQRHAAEDDRVRVIQRANGGLAAARNTGLAAASAEFIAPVDADDLWAPTKIEKQVLAMRRGGPKVALAYTWFAAIDAHGRRTGAVHAPTEEGYVLARMCRGNLVGNGSGALMRTEAVRACGGYDESLRARNAQGCEDLKLYYQLAEKWLVALVPESLTGYRQHATAMSADFAQMWRSYRFVADEMRAAHPELAQDVREGLSFYAVFLFWKAVGARRRSDALRLLGLHLRYAGRNGFATLVQIAKKLRRRGRGANGTAAWGTTTMVAAGLPFDIGPVA